MYLVDITADLNDEDETGYVWTFLDEARDPGQIHPGALVIAGDEEAAAVVYGAFGCGGLRFTFADSAEAQRIASYFRHQRLNTLRLIN